MGALIGVDEFGAPCCGSCGGEVYTVEASDSDDFHDRYSEPRNACVIACWIRDGLREHGGICSGGGRR